MVMKQREHKFSYFIIIISLLVTQKQINFELEASGVEKAARFIFGQLTQGGKNWAVSETEFYFFVAHLLHTKLSASIQPYLRLINDHRTKLLNWVTAFSLRLPLLLILLIECVGEWFDAPSETSFAPSYEVPRDVARFEISSSFLARLDDFFNQAAFHGNAKLELLSPMRERAGLPLTALYAIDMEHER